MKMKTNAFVEMSAKELQTTEGGSRITYHITAITAAVFALAESIVQAVRALVAIRPPRP
jgi:hypothetical protein